MITLTSCWPNTTCWDAPTHAHCVRTARALADAFFPKPMALVPLHGVEPLDEVLAPCWRASRAAAAALRLTPKHPVGAAYATGRGARKARIREAVASAADGMGQAAARPTRLVFVLTS